MAKAVNPDKGKSITWYRDEKLAAEWQRDILDRIHALIIEVEPKTMASIKWAQPVWETPEGPVIFFRGAAKHVTLGFWRGAELTDPTNRLEGEGDRMKHLKMRSEQEFDPAFIRDLVGQAIRLNAIKGDPTKGR